MSGLDLRQMAPGRMLDPVGLLKPSKKTNARRSSKRLREITVQTYAVVDIGSSKTVCMIGRTEPHTGNLHVVGVGVSPSYGLRQGAVADIDAVERAVRAAVEQAERAAGFAVAEVLVSYSGAALSSLTVFGTAAITDPEISMRETTAAVRNGLEKVGTAGRYMLHATPLGYKLDGDHIVRDPRGMSARQLEVGMHVLVAPAAAARNLAIAIEKAHLGVEKIVAAPYATGLGTLIEDEQSLGMICVDLGAGSTKISAFVDGCFTYASAIPIGGIRVTQDVAHGLNATFASAEKLKLGFARLDRSASEDAELAYEQIGDDGSPHKARTTHHTLANMVGSRVEEILEMVRDQLDRANLTSAVVSRVALTGGGSQLPGVREMAQRVLGRTVRLSRPPKLPGLPDTAQSPAYATAMGLLKFKHHRPADACGTRRPQVESEALRSGLLARATAWLFENL